MAHSRKTVIFNEDSHEGELKEWCDQQSSNFSGFVKSVLFAYKTNIHQFTVPKAPQIEVDKNIEYPASSMDDIL